MRGITLESELEVIEFAKKAAQSFSDNPQFTTFTKSDVEAGCLFAVRWGLGGDCVLVFKLDESFEPINFYQLIKPKAPKD